MVAVGVAHHVTQRGVGRQTVFYTQRDRKVYLGLLAEQSRLAGVRVLAYCLMSNHIHLVVVPDEEGAMALCLQRVHGRYAQYLNARRRRSGHLWQNRYFSCPLDERRLWTALRYVGTESGAGGDGGRRERVSMEFGGGAFGRAGPEPGAGCGVLGADGGSGAMEATAWRARG